jgi:hypothetical protein
MSWTKLEVASPELAHCSRGLPDTYRNSVALLNGYLYVFGGKQNASFSVSHISCLDLEECRWVKLNYE